MDIMSGEKTSYGHRLVRPSLAFGLASQNTTPRMQTVVFDDGSILTSDRRRIVFAVPPPTTRLGREMMNCRQQDRVR
jgi:hypothetical protein